MINFSDANTTLISCRFEGNTAVTGGGLYNQATSDVLVIGCLFAGNMSTNRGGGISNNFANATIINTSVVRNLAGSVGGGIATNQNSVTVHNSVVWGNEDLTGGTATDQLYLSFATLTASHSCIQNWATPGVDGNTDANPLFTRLPDDGGNGWGNANDDYGNLHVLAGSSLIDSGRNGHLPFDAFDLDDDGDLSERVPIDLAGITRRIDDAAVDTGMGNPPIVDMGVFEYLAADCNYDGSVTLTDLADGASCLTGPGKAVGAGCACLDLDASDTVDLLDVAGYQTLFGTPPTP